LNAPAHWHIAFLLAETLAKLAGRAGCGEWLTGITKHDGAAQPCLALVFAGHWRPTAPGGILLAFSANRLLRSKFEHLHSNTNSLSWPGIHTLGSSSFVHDLSEKSDACEYLL
jgi:hypothetical protein